MIERHYEIAHNRAKAEQARANKYEEYLIEINKIVYAQGLNLGSKEYFRVRGMCAEAETAKNLRVREEIKYVRDWP